jgi:hypothetical protein
MRLLSVLLLISGISAVENRRSQGVRGEQRDSGRTGRSVTLRRDLIRTTAEVTNADASRSIGNQGTRNTPFDAEGNHHIAGLLKSSIYDNTFEHQGNDLGEGNRRLQTLDCRNKLASSLMQVKEVFSRNPMRCCDSNGPSTVLVTHAQYDESTPTGFEPFWNTFFLEVDATTKLTGTCFVMTGVNQTMLSVRTLTDVMIDINKLVSNQSSVPAYMTTDPSEGAQLANLFRGISQQPGSLSLGVFNSGFANLQAEALVAGSESLPFVGYTDDDLYGQKAADITLRLLKTVKAKPLCFNGRPDLPFVGRRCAAYYKNVTSTPPSRYVGVTCREDSSVDAILGLLVDGKINSVFVHVDCCKVVALAAQRAKDEFNQTIVVGCQDDDTSQNGYVNFVTAQPIELEAYHVASWVSLPVVDDIGNQTGRDRALFPAPPSFLNTDIYNIVIF